VGGVEHADVQVYSLQHVYITLTRTQTKRTDLHMYAAHSHWLELASTVWPEQHRRPHMNAPSEYGASDDCPDA
jgi:hypothetical protein